MAPKDDTANFWFSSGEVIPWHSSCFQLKLSAFLLPNTKPEETSRALNRNKTEAAGSFTLLMSSKLNDYKILWLLQMTSQHTNPKSIGPSTTSEFIQCYWRA